MCNFRFTKMRKILLAFDFDQTIVNENSDIVLCNKYLDGVFPQRVRDIYNESGWPSSMQEMCRILHARGCMEEHYIQCLQNLQFAPSMIDFFGKIDPSLIDCIIISDCNVLFIDYFLKQNHIKDVFDAVHANPAYYDDEGLLKIGMYQEQDWCQLSERNMCKGTVLCEYVEKKLNAGVEYAHVGYVGDGGNDLCPGLCLRERDILFVREGFSLDKCIVDKKAKGEKLTSGVLLWNEANQIRDQVNIWLNDKKENEILAAPRLLPVR